MVVGLHLLAAHRARLGERLLAQVVGAEAAEGVDRPHQEGRAERRERLGAGLERLARLVDERLERRVVGDLGLAGAAHHDGLEVLAAEDGADAAAPGDTLAVAPVMSHRGDAHAMLARRTDRDRVRVGALGVDQRRHGLARRLAPELRRRLQRGARLGYQQVGRRGRAAGDHHRVEARALERRREAPAEGRVEEEAGQR